jgi:hypothetical protein
MDQAIDKSMRPPRAAPVILAGKMDSQEETERTEDERMMKIQSLIVEVRGN